MSALLGAFESGGEHSIMGDNDTILTIVSSPSVEDMRTNNWF